jgi:hypothetical protein
MSSSLRLLPDFYRLGQTMPPQHAGSKARLSCIHDIVNCHVKIAKMRDSMCGAVRVFLDQKLPTINKEGARNCVKITITAGGSITRTGPFDERHRSIRKLLIWVA